MSAKRNNDARALMLADLAKSGLDEKDAKQLRCAPLTPDETAELVALPKLKHFTYKLAYFDLDGEANEFWRVRFLEEVRITGDGGKQKHLRYLQPKDSQPQAYFPPYVDWIAIADDVSREINITEGEKKAAKACKEGITTIGLGGVWNFKSKKAEIEFLPELDNIDWEGRRVNIIFDVGERGVAKDVRAARKRLRDLLIVRGAIVSRINLPPGENGAKVGLDDFLVANDARAFRKLVPIPENAMRIELVEFDLKALLGPIRPEAYVVPGLVPADAYTLIAGALSSYKTTALVALTLWRATGQDVLGFGRLAEADTGPCVIAFYEDAEWRIHVKFQLIVQRTHEAITKRDGAGAAGKFADRVKRNVRLVPLTGLANGTIVHRTAAGLIVPNYAFIDGLVTSVKRYTSDPVLLGIDPLRLAIAGSQNDDDGADVVVRALNSFSNLLPGSGTAVNSHTTKVVAREGAGSGYADAAYATSGSALYSQHARSNLHIARLTAKDITNLFDATVVAPEDAKRQAVAKLTHGRLSHGVETAEAYYRMAGGILVPIEPRTAPRSAADAIATALPLTAAAIERLRGEGMSVTQNNLGQDAALGDAFGSRSKILAALKTLEDEGLLAYAGATKDRSGALTEKGVARLAELRPPSPEAPGFRSNGGRARGARSGSGSNRIKSPPGRRGPGAGEGK